MSPECAFRERGTFTHPQTAEDWDMLPQSSSPLVTGTDFLSLPSSARDSSDSLGKSHRPHSCLLEFPCFSRCFLIHKAQQYQVSQTRVLGFTYLIFIKSLQVFTYPFKGHYRNTYYGATCLHELIFLIRSFQKY